RAGGAPLTPAERALAAGVADALAQLVASERQAAELRQTRELLGRADRLSALGMLAAGVAHEIRNPLVSVRTFIQLLPERLADEAQVKQVLMNLRLNALQACGSHGSVEITTRSEEDRGERWCTVTVGDSGAGIPPEHVEQIFDPFFTTKDAGSGLGLFIARQI